METTLDEKINKKVYAGEKTTPKEDTIRKAHLIALMGLGYTERLLVSQDYVINWPGRPLLTSEGQRRLAPEWNLTHLFRNIFPALKQAGITDKQIDTLLIDNPRRWLEGK